MRDGLLTSREVASILCSNVAPLLARMPEITEADLKAVFNFLWVRLEYFDEMKNKPLDPGLDTPERAYVLLCLAGMCLDAFNNGIAARSVTADALKWMSANTNMLINHINYGPKKGDA
jgi:hypothetical protein